jgi:ArsR family transcriptional regulator
MKAEASGEVRSLRSNGPGGKDLFGRRTGGSPNSGFDTPESIITIFLVMSEAVAFFRAVADETRWRIVRLVIDQALCVCELAEILGMPQSSASSHVQIIRKAGMLESETCGKWTYFRIAKEQHAFLHALLRKFPDTAQARDDAAKCEVLLARRKSSCCTGPVKLAKPRKSRTLVKS